MAILKVNYLIYKLLFLCFISLNVSFGQAPSKITTSILFSTDTIKFDTTSILNSSFQLILDSKVIEKSDYYLNPTKAEILLYRAYPSHTKLEIEYNQLPINLNKVFAHKSDSIIFTSSDTNRLENYLYQTEDDYQSLDFFGGSPLKKQGSISRGVTVGNAQNLSFQSTLNLQISGKIGPDLFIKGSISDDNVPFQPDGNTQKLQEFDQVFLQIYNANFAVTGGDFWLRKPKGYFLNYEKRTQGLSIDYQHSFEAEGSKPIVKHKLSGTFSKGKFARNIIQGIEGNQGPYRLRGTENEQNIIILAGTEKVYIDGTLLKRGQAFDYTINYNSGEIIFTANQFITKDKRIIIEFQYSDLNYARSLFAYNASIESEKYDVWFNYYNEQDAKNQPIQQGLDLEQKQVLSLAGDNITDALISSISQVDYSEDRILYYLKDSTIYDPITNDSLIYDSVLVFSNNPDSAKYQANFKIVGDKKGNYIIDKYTANGKVFKWVPPISGIPQGNYEPIQLLIPPQKKQMITIGGQYRFSDYLVSDIEFAISNTDLNTFSNFDQKDNKGYGLKWNLNQHKRFKKNKIDMSSILSFELNDKNFKQIQWFRSPEFDRDWNVRNNNYLGNQYLSKFEFSVAKSGLGKVRYGLNQFTWGENYNGLKNDLKLNFNKKGYQASFDGNFLWSNGQEVTQYLRHKANLSKKWSKFKIGLTDIHEKNNIFLADILATSSYQFYDIKAYISTGDSLSNFHELYYQQRYDWLSDSVKLNYVAKAENIGFTSHFLKQKANQLKFNVNYRQLNIFDTTLIKQAPEKTILGRIEHNLYLWKGALTSRIFYELNSGLELKRDFIYLLVNAGQGVYTWIDYNNDGIKDIGEFEIAQFPDQAEYIRVSISSNDFIRTYGNQFSQSVFIKPEKLLRKAKGVKKVISLFSNQTNYKINRKTNFEDGLTAFNPFVYNVSDTNLIQLSSTFRNTLFFNRLNPNFGLEYNIQINSSKFVLTNGFDLSSRNTQKIKLRWNISKSYNFQLEYNNGQKISESQYATNRNYNYELNVVKTSISYQPNTKFRIALLEEYSIKENDSDLSEKAITNEIGTELRYNQTKKGSLSANFKYILIDYNSSANTPLAFEMLNALKPGANYTWGFTYQRKIAGNLQLNFNYFGRKSETTKFLHSGGMELRAFF